MPDTRDDALPTAQDDNLSALKSNDKTTKTVSYVVPCSSQFRDAVLALAERRQAQPGELVKAVFLMVEPVRITEHVDPEEPHADDRETVVLQSGPQAGRAIRRKPRLQLRLPAGFSVPFLRKALALALDMADQSVLVELRHRTVPHPDVRVGHLEQKIADLDAEIQTLREVLTRVAFRPLSDGVVTEADARYVLGLTPREQVGGDIVKQRFKLLAQAFHPDRRWGDKSRMVQVLDARKLLESRIRHR
jgi:hypothetical protein